jgi:hypothetical protein
MVAPRKMGMARRGLDRAELSGRTATGAHAWTRRDIEEGGQAGWDRRPDDRFWRREEDARCAKAYAPRCREEAR